MSPQTESILSSPATAEAQRERDAYLDRVMDMSDDEFAEHLFAIATENADAAPPCFDNGRCVGHERYPGAGTLGLRYCS